MGKIVGQYLRQNKKTIALFICSVLIFASIFYLYNADVKAVTYASLLSLVLAIGFAIWDFGQFYHKHKILEDLRENLVFDFQGLPIKSNLIEEDYQKLLQVLYEDRASLIYDMDREKSEMMDYYTLWAHQIKTPISSMTLLLQMNETDNNKALLSELFKIEQYVNMVLSYLRLESSSTDFLFDNYDLENMVKQAVRKYAPLFIRKKIAAELDNLDFRVLTDEKWMIFVIEQLLSNSLKYTNSGKIIIYGKDNNTLVIEDTGMGIGAEDIPRLGEKGFTGYNGRYDKKSTGLGLYLCKKILVKLSHSIVIESEVGKYTRVSIKFEKNKLVKD